jgi:lysophospholipase L1-like esterase
MRLPLLLVALLLAPAQAPAPAPSAATGPDPSQYEADIHAFEIEDMAEPPPKGGIIFTGSSSIRMWTSLKEDFPGLPVRNRGFGGSMIPEVTAFLDRIIVPHKPRLVVLYCGTNDLNAGRSPTQVMQDFDALVKQLHDELPTTRLLYISIAPNPARWSQLDAQKAVNRAVQWRAETDPRITFIDVASHMLGPDGHPLPGIYIEDGLHMNEKGYAIWTEVVRPYLRF